MATNGNFLTDLPILNVLGRTIKVNGGATTGTKGGDVIITSGTGTGSVSGDGGNIVFISGNSDTTGSGGDIQLVGGNSLATGGDGGDITIKCGSSSATGGEIDIKCGESGTGATGNGGDLSVLAGIGGQINIVGGAVSGTGAVGTVTLSGGDSGTGATGDGGSLIFNGGTSLGGSVSGGKCTIEVESVGANIDGISLTVLSADSRTGTIGDGGIITIKCGTPLSTNSNGGSLKISGGGSTTGNKGGDVVLTTGTGALDGKLNFFLGGQNNGSVKYIWPTTSASLGQELRVSSVTGTNPTVITMDWVTAVITVANTMAITLVAQAWGPGDAMVWNSNLDSAGTIVPTYNAVTGYVEVAQGSVYLVTVAIFMKYNQSIAQIQIQPQDLNGKNLCLRNVIYSPTFNFQNSSQCSFNFIVNAASTNEAAFRVRYSNGNKLPFIANMAICRLFDT
jgi:hypothetical protein